MLEGRLGVPRTDTPGFRVHSGAKVSRKERACITGRRELVLPAPRREPEGVGPQLDPRVDEYIARLPQWQQAVSRRVREAVHAADPEVEETIKRSVLPYFVLQGNVCALSAAKDHVNIFIYDPLVPDPRGIINQGRGNATARAVQIYRDDTTDWDALQEMLRAVIARNRAGGWRRL